MPQRLLTHGVSRTPRSGSGSCMPFCSLPQWESRRLSGGPEGCRRIRRRRRPTGRAAAGRMPRVTGRPARVRASTGPERRGEQPIGETYACEPSPTPLLHPNPPATRNGPGTSTATPAGSHLSTTRGGCRRLSSQHSNLNEYANRNASSQLRTTSDPRPTRQARAATVEAAKWVRTMRGA